MITNPKVTIVVGGRWHAFDLAKGLKARGALHRLVTNYPWFKVARWGFDHNEVVCLPTTQWMNQLVQRMLPARQRIRFQHFIHSRFAAAAAKHLGQPDVVHGWSSFSEPSIERCKHQGIPFVLERGSSHIVTQTRLLQEEQKQLGLAGAITHPGIVATELREYAAADQIAVPSRFVERTFIENGVPADKLFRNPLGVNLERFTPTEGNRTSDEPFRVIYAGSLTFRKGIHYLVDGFRQTAIAGAQLILVGGASVETAQLIGVPPEGLKRIGHVPQAELANLYRRASVFAIASIEEGMAMVQAQALACGLPLICTENSGGEDLLELLADSETPIEEASGGRRYSAGFVVPIRNPDAIARCLRRLASEPELLGSQRRAANRIHRLNLNWQSYADRAISDYMNFLKPCPA